MKLYNDPRMSTILTADAYKYSQYPMYHNATELFNYLESRGGLYDETVQAGLRIFVKQYLTEPITKEQIDYAEEMVTGMGEPFNREGFDIILNKYGGKWPVEIYAVPEGSIVPRKNVLMAMKNIGGAETAWVVQFLETVIFPVWYTINIATISHEIRKIIHGHLARTADDMSGITFKLHNFGARGSSCPEAASIGGYAHLIPFLGTDNMSSLQVAREYYDADIAGFSIPATEHSNMTFKKIEGERDQLEFWLDLNKDRPICACVGDSYNMDQFITYCGQMKDKIFPNGPILVVRPDSGDPVDMCTHVLKRLEEEGFKYEVNSKGFKMFEGVRVIYGDGISDPKVIDNILTFAAENGYSADNIAFGMGAGLMQKHDRDTQRFAIKLSAAVVDGEVVEIYKDPVTDPGKGSKRGYQDLIKNAQGVYETINQDPSNNPDSQLKLIYRLGEVLDKDSIVQIRERYENELKFRL